MFCTYKERETCDSEKLGCEGCFYFYDENNKKKGDLKMERKFEYVSRLKEGIGLPKRSTENSAGYDFICQENIICKAKEITMVKTGVKAQFPNDEMLLLFNRSSNPKKKGLIILNGVGVVDAKI